MNNDRYLMHELQIKADKIYVINYMSICEFEEATFKFKWKNLYIDRVYIVDPVLYNVLMAIVSITANICIDTFWLVYI